jgi:NAD(P)-dependent dehydrogenase (short-subunit alcohol dehydrogenase family)
MDTPRIRNTLQKTYGGSEESMLRQRDRQVPLGFMGDAWDVAHAAVFLASDKARYISGAEIVIDGALTATTRPATSIE